MGRKSNKKWTKRAKQYLKLKLFGNYDQFRIMAMTYFHKPEFKRACDRSTL